MVIFKHCRKIWHIVIYEVFLKHMTSHAWKWFSLLYSHTSYIISGSQSWNIILNILTDSPPSSNPLPLWPPQGERTAATASHRRPVWCRGEPSNTLWWDASSELPPLKISTSVISKLLLAVSCRAALGKILQAVKSGFCTSSACGFQSWAGASYRQHLEGSSHPRPPRWHAATMSYPSILLTSIPKNVAS